MHVFVGFFLCRWVSALCFGSLFGVKGWLGVVEVCYLGTWGEGDSGCEVG